MLQTQLSIIIVNYRTPQMLVSCLSSVYRFTSNLSFEVIVVDNASGDNSREIIQPAFPQVRWIQLDYNAGFARANNEGIRQSSANTVLLLNSDTLVNDNAIGKCFDEFTLSPYVACGVQLLNADGSPQISGNYFMRGSLNNLLPLPYVGAFIRFAGNLFGAKKPHVPDTDAAVEVDWINGAFLMVKKSAIDKAGLMDEDFFLYAEEAEWCHRLKKTGDLAIFGQNKVIHLQGQTSNETFNSKSEGYYNLYDRKGLQIMLSNFVRIRKQFGAVWFIFHLLAYTLTIPVYFIGIFIEAIFTFSNPQKDLANFAGYFRNVMRLWGFFGKILANRPTFYKVL
jgi:GT2 family glycosyltransferase